MQIIKERGDKMKINIRNDSVEIDGYVNAVERKSKVLKTRTGQQFVERICKGAFGDAIKKKKDVRLLLNHNWQRDLGGTGDGNLELNEDNIGLHARAVIVDKDVIDKARAGKLCGWSFGFYDVDVDTHEEQGILTRDVKALDLCEVSLLDTTRNPAYDGQLVTVRDDGNVVYSGETFLDEIETRDETPIDYSKYENIIKEMKGEN